MTSDMDVVWRMLEEARTAFLTTWHGDALQSRPMAIYARRDDGAIYFLTDAASEKDDAIRKHPKVNIALQVGSSYLSVAGDASASHNVPKIKELWTPFAKAWWDGPEDPTIRLLSIAPVEAHYWKTPGKVVATLAMLAEVTTGAKQKNLGREKRVRM